ncbi:MAG TPA: glycosyltransferase [Cyclobacteriaceae bacterium]|jgi:GT2 family glycosyltransferase|nr:glycosyltransferase [Cyclobacteriaceae bacterium]
MVRYDVIVPTYNRFHLLPIFFEKNSLLQDKDVRLWVIDDCSPDFDASVIPPWQNLTLLRLNENKGQAFARNFAIAKGSAPYIISLDDDAWFENAATSLEQISDNFNRYPDAGCLMFNIKTPNSEYSKLSSGTELALHVTCGCAYRREMLEQVHSFSGFLHSGAEETDLSLRIYHAGWKVRFIKEIEVFHNFEPSARSLSWLLNVRRNTTRNDLLIILMYYPGPYVGLFLFGKFFNHLRFALTHKVSVMKSFLVTCGAFVDFLGMSPKALTMRKPLSIKLFRHWRKLKQSQA